MENNLDFLYDIDYVEKHIFRFCVATEYESDKIVRIEVYKYDKPVFLWYPNTLSNLVGFKRKISRSEYKYCCQIFANCTEKNVKEIQALFTYD